MWPMLAANRVEKRVAPIYDFNHLCAVMKSRAQITLISHANGAVTTGMINGIVPESGCGKSWIVTICTRENKVFEIWVKSN